MCAQNGWCEAVSNPKPDGWRCRATSEAACQAAVVSCGYMGSCHFDAANHDCFATSDSECLSSAGCRDHGYCHVVNGGCAVVGAQDCLKSAACKDGGWCSFVNTGGVGRCDSPPPTTDCRSLPGCAKHGWCQFVSNTLVSQCAPGSEQDCAQSADCKNKGICHYWLYAADCVK